ncbi:DNRLRE domain-containing protein [Nocardioides sp. WS12]|uniref:DNRLRE domain-containing protein n=1 Tax=Nocardioides sp. WS12 TaxID=2486272 RepID=UPI0015FA7CF6|nr:DNRLRE domain-containing protein [Nocardioides sp. WS12]
MGIPVLAAALAFSAGQVTAPARAAAPEVAAKQAAPKVAERPDRTSAMVTAISQGSRVEDLSARTPSSGMYANPNGTWTLESYSGQVRSKDSDDKWVSADPTLETSKDGVTSPAAVPFDVEYGDGGSKDLATVTSNSGSKLSVDWSTKLPAGSVDSDQITFDPAGVENGELVVTSHREGFNFSVVLDKAPAAGEVPEYRFSLSLSEGKFITRPDGSIDIKSDGKLIGSITPPLMWDSADEAPTVPVEATLEGTGTSRELVLRPDPVYLADPERTYPVTVDPTVILTATGDTWVQNILPNTSQHTSPELRVGTSNLGISQNRSYLNFDTTALGSPSPGSIANAKVSLSNFNAGSCSGSAIKMSQITSSWTVPGITWSTQPTVTATGASTNDAAHGFTGCTSEGVVDFDATAIVKSWVGGADNYGVQLAAVTLNNASYRKYRSLENGDNAKSPKLTVTISQPPATPTGLIATPGLYGNFITSKTPTLSSVITDPDGGQVKGYYEIKQGSTSVWSDTTPAVASGGTTTIAVPAGNLTEGSTYTISAWGEDDVNVRSATPATKTVTVDTIAPTVTITSSHFTNGTWTTTMPGSDTITLNGSADTAGFYFNLDGQTSAAGANSSGDKVTTYTPTPGWHVYEVTPVDKAGNYGTPVTFSYGTGTAAFTTPGQWTPSTASFPIDMSGPASATGATLQWRLYGETTWRTAAKVKNADGTNWTGTVTLTGRSATNPLIWNATEETYGTGTLGGNALLETRGCFQYSGSADSCTTTLYLSLLQSAFGDRFPITELGPAQVALLSGEAMIADTDAADSKAGIARTFASLSDATLADGIFGPGWSDPQVLVSQSDAAATIVDNRTKDGTLIVVDSSGGSQTFTSTGGGTYKPLQPTGDATGLTFTIGTGGNPDTLVLARPLGTASVTTTWEWKTSDTGGDPAWIVKATDAPGTSNDIVVTSTSQRPTFIQESDPAASATCNTTTQTEGCRALKITYTGTGSATRVSKVERLIGAATPGAVTLKALADYTYTSGKLTKVCGPDPDGAGAATSLCTEYTYTTVASRTMLATLKPAGLTEWRFTYDSIGRLENVKRERPTASGGGDATWSIDYSLNPASSGPDMTSADVAEWGQQVVPTKVYAVYRPYTGSASLTKAELIYTTSTGIVTNTAGHGPTGWLVDTIWFDANQNAVQRLDGTGWARVQATAAADRPRVAAEASSYSVYNTWGDADTVGNRLVDEYGPAHTASLKNGTTGLFRTHTQTMYDDDPSVDAALITNRPGVDGLGLAVKETTSTSDAVRTTDYDATVVTYGYDPVVAGDGNGWTLGSPTTVKTQVNASTWSTETTRFDASGREVESRQPGGGANGAGAGTDAHSTVTSYYTATGAGDCGGKPAWDGLVCKVGPAGQPVGQPMPVTWTTAYDEDLQPTNIQETSGVTTRTTSMTFDGLGRTKTMNKAITGSGATNDTIATTFGYADATGLPTTTTSAGSSITTGYDTWGRTASYVDALGTNSATTYQEDGRVATFNDGAATYTYSYGTHGELDSLNAGGGVGSFDYAYKPNGVIDTITYPNGMLAKMTSDEVGTPTGLTYAQGAAQLLAFTATNVADGRTIDQVSTASAQTFTFDGLGRLGKVEDSRAGGCTTRTYGFDASSNRNAFASYNPGTGGACQTTTAAIDKTSDYDSAGRITNAGYTYDTLGRTLTTPQADAGPNAAGILTATYRANDMVASLSQNVANGTGGSTAQAMTYELDPAERINSFSTTTGGTETNRTRYRFAETGDSPASVDVSADQGSTWTATRYVSAPVLGMAASTTNGTTTLQLTNLHGDIVTTTPGSSGASTIGAFTETDEFGNQKSADVAVARFGYLGSFRRSADALGGFMQMGARLFNPSTGGFTSLDPQRGGNLTGYTYPQNPVDELDLNGKARVIRCHLSVYHPHWSKHDRTSVNVKAQIKCSGAGGGFVDSLNLFVNLYIRVYFPDTRWVLWQPGKTYRSRSNNMVTAYDPAPCANATFRAQAWGTIRFPVGYSPSTARVSASSPVTEVRCYGR